MSSKWTEGWEPQEGQWTLDAALACGAGADMSPSPAPRFGTGGAYVGFCRRRYPEVFGGRFPGAEMFHDGRLIGAAWCRLSPTVWARNFPRFVEYWEKAAWRPETVGSPCNVSPETALEAALAEVPAWIAGTLGERLRDRAGRMPRWWRLPRRRRRRLVLAAVAARRASARRWVSAGRWAWAELLDIGALAALGRLCPEGQQAVLDAAAEGGLAAWAVNGGGSVRARYLLPAIEAARPTLDALESPAGGRVRLARAMEPGESALGHRAASLARAAGLDPECGPAALSPYLAPAYPAVPMEVARRICLGESPRQISGGVLTSREAHRWCLDGAPSVTMWLQREVLGRRDAVLPDLRDPEVIRWLAAVHRRGGWGQLTRERPVTLPGGETASWRALDRTDEIQSEDLDRGERTRVDDAFASAARRAEEAWNSSAREGHQVLAPTPQGWRPYRRVMRVLNTRSLLAHEGREMGHCVGGYADAVRKGQCVILSLRLPRKGVRSTAELALDGRVRQHSGQKNTPPHPVLERVLRRFVERRIGARRV